MTEANNPAGDVVVERSYNAPIERVWDALTVNDQMKQWYFKLPEFRPEVGFEFEFEAGPPGKSYLHKCKVTNVVPQRTLAYTWRYDGYQGISTVTFDLFPDGEGTRVRVTHSGLDSFAVNNDPGFDKHNFVEGWNSILGTSLKNFVEK